MKFKTIGERITYARTLRGWKKNHLAREVDVSPAAVTQWEQGDTKGLKPENLVAVARALKVQTDWLAAEEGPMERENFLHVQKIIEEIKPMDTWKRDVFFSLIHTVSPSLAQALVRLLVPHDPLQISSPTNGVHEIPSVYDHKKV